MCLQTARRDSGRRAFTLVELLVVITIIAILMASSMPAFSKARLTAKRTKCMAHLRGIGQGMKAYLVDNSERYPYASSFPLPPDPPAPGIVAGESALEPPDDEDPLPDADLPPIYEALGRELGHQQKVFICPADHNTQESRIETRTYHETLGTSYEWEAWAYNGKRVGHTRYTGKKGAPKESGLGLEPHEAPMIYDYEAFHGGAQKRGSLVTLYADLHVSADTWVDAVAEANEE
jgi:prepilin-type N-terminal cleavage/methylation domain-containing protein